MAAGDHTVVGTMTANKVAVTDTVVVANLNADQVDGADKDTDVALAANSDAKIASQKATKAYVDTHAALAVAGTHGSTVAGTADKLVHRDASGRAQMVNPAAAQDIATKNYVDGKIASLQCKIIEIGDWNMDTGVTKNVAHGIGASFKNIRTIRTIIRNDADTHYYPLERVGNIADPTLLAGGITDIDVGNICLLKRAGGFFDSADFVTSPAGNRGWVTIWYEA